MSWLWVSIAMVLVGFPSRPQDKPLQLLQTGRKQEHALIKGLSPMTWQETHSQTSSFPCSLSLGHLVRHMAVPGHKAGWELSICHFQPQLWERGSATRKKVNQCLPPYFTFVFPFIISQIFFSSKDQFRCPSQSIIPYLILCTNIYCQR